MSDEVSQDPQAVAQNASPMFDFGVLVVHPRTGEAIAMPIAQFALALNSLMGQSLVDSVKRMADVPPSSLVLPEGLHVH